MTKSISLPPHLLYLLHGMKRIKWNADKRRRALIGIEKVLMAKKPN